MQKQQEVSGTTLTASTPTSTAAKMVSALLKCNHLEELDVLEWEHTSVLFLTIIYLNETKSSTETHRAQSTAQIKSVYQTPGFLFLLKKRIDAFAV